MRTIVLRHGSSSICWFIRLAATNGSSTTAHHSCGAVELHMKSILNLEGYHAGRR
ncbi:Hypothetical protein RY69_1493 [Bifidobacterium breve]|nr:Hypothetical protein RY69_1493 [Bifidobacterium breve]